MSSQRKTTCVMRAPDVLAAALAGIAALAMTGCGGPGAKASVAPQTAAPMTKEAGDLVRLGVDEPFNEGQLSIIGLRHFLMYTRFLSLSAAPEDEACKGQQGECASGDSATTPQPPQK